MPPSQSLRPSAYKCESTETLRNYTADLWELGERDPSKAWEDSNCYFKLGLLGSSRFISAFAFAMSEGDAVGIDAHLLHNSNEFG